MNFTIIDECIADVILDYICERSKDAYILYQPRGNHYRMFASEEAMAKKTKTGYYILNNYSCGTSREDILEDLQHARESEEWFGYKVVSTTPSVTRNFIALMKERRV